MGPTAPPSRAGGGIAGTRAARAHTQAPRGGAQSPYEARTLWQRDASASDWSGKAVVALMVNGAQGDDDEAHGGHFAIVTGRIARDGNIGQWLANNFYSLDVESGRASLRRRYRSTITWATSTADKRGTGRATSSCSCCATPAPRLVQSALGRVFNQFYRHQLTY